MRNLSDQRSEIYDRSWVVKARAMAGLRQIDVATACGISVGNYNKIENGICTPNVKIGLRIADALGVDVRNFLNERRIA